MAAGALSQIIAFVEGELAPSAFAEALARETGFEQVLAVDPHRPRQTFVGDSLFLHVIGEDFGSPAGVLNAHTALVQFLERNGHRVRPTRQYRDFYALILSAQPKWLDLDEAYLRREILPAARGLAGGALKQWLRDELLRRYKCVDKPPRWLQNPQWPMGEHGPLVFLGQLPVKGYFHDHAAAYVFHDPATAECRTVVQVC